MKENDKIKVSKENNKNTMLEKIFSTVFAKKAATIFFSVLVLILFGPAPARAACDYDHAGADWTPTNGDAYDLDASANIGIAGIHCNIGIFTVPAGITVYIYGYDGTNYGKLDISAASLTISGTLSATGKGYAAGTGPGAGTSGSRGGGGGGTSIRLTTNDSTPGGGRSDSQVYTIPAKPPATNWREILPF